jgi:deleted-in-malignant-brain-tumors protein 1
MRLLVRDNRGVRADLRESLLAYKRRDLGAMMAGRALPPTFGGLLFTDVDRGMDCYEEPHYESRTTHAYVPAPISGVFGGGAGSHRAGGVCCGCGICDASSFVSQC